MHATAGVYSDCATTHLFKTEATLWKSIDEFRVNWSKRWSMIAFGKSKLGQIYALSTENKLRGEYEIKIKLIAVQLQNDVLLSSNEMIFQRRQNCNESLI